MNYNGIKLITNEHLKMQFRFPKSKKARIRKKWSNRPENFGPDKNGYFINKTTFVCHPSLAGKIRKTIDDIDSKRPLMYGIPEDEHDPFKYSF